MLYCLVPSSMGMLDADDKVVVKGKNRSLRNIIDFVQRLIPIPVYQMRKYKMAHGCDILSRLEVLMPYLVEWHGFC